MKFLSSFFLWIIFSALQSQVSCKEHLHPKLFAKFPVTFHDGKSLEIWHFPPSKIFTPEEFDQLHLQGTGPIFQSCFDFNLDSKLSDFDVIAKYVHGTYFDGFLLVQPGIQAKALGTLTLSHKPIDSNSCAVFIFNMCLAPDLQGLGYGGLFIDRSLASLYARLKLKPSMEKPVLLGLSLMTHNPTYLAACKAYVKAGFYLYDYGNVTYKSRLYLQDKVQELLQLSPSSPMTVTNRDFDNSGLSAAGDKGNYSQQSSSSAPRNPLPFRFIPTGREEDKIVSLFRLDVNGEGLIDFAYPPTDFCLQVKLKMEQAVEEMEAKIAHKKPWDDYSFDEDGEEDERGI